MSVNKKYSLILMSDDNSTIRIRMSKRILKFITILLIVIPILFIISLWVTFQSAKKEQNIRMSYNSQQQELIELRVKVERLDNVNVLLEKYDDTYLVKNELDFAPSKGKEEANKVTEKTKEDVAPTTVLANELKANEIAEANKQAVTLSELNDRNNQESIPLKEEFTSASSSIDMNLAKTEKLKVKTLSQNSLQISFDLVNTRQKNQLEGNVQFFLLDKAGNKIALNANSKETSYKINKLKKVVVEAKYEAGTINPKEHILIIEINNNPEGIIYREQVELLTE